MLSKGQKGRKKGKGKTKEMMNTNTKYSLTEQKLDFPIWLVTASETVSELRFQAILPLV